MWRKLAFPSRVSPKNRQFVFGYQGKRLACSPILIAQRGTLTPKITISWTGRAAHRWKWFTALFYLGTNFITKLNKLINFRTSRKEFPSCKQLWAGHCLLQTLQRSSSHHSSERCTKAYLSTSALRGKLCKIPYNLYQKLQAGSLGVAQKYFKSSHSRCRIALFRSALSPDENNMKKLSGISLLVVTSSSWYDRL